MEKMTDSRILALYFDRDSRAVEATAAQYGGALSRLANRFVSPEDADECVNDTYMSAWTGIPPTRPDNLFAWLARVCRNHAFGRIRKEEAQKRSARLVDLSEEMAECLPDPSLERQRESEELGIALTDFLRSLSQEKRVMFLRRYWFGDSIAEIADTFGFTESKVKVTMMRLREQLKIYLEQEGVAL